MFLLDMYVKLKNQFNKVLKNKTFEEKQFNFKAVHIVK